MKLLPWMKVWLCGATTPAPATVSAAPDGLLANVIGTLLGSSLTVSMSVRPWLSVTVTWSSRSEGYSWSGAGNDPVRWPDHVVSGWL